MFYQDLLFVPVASGLILRMACIENTIPFTWLSNIFEKLKSFVCMRIPQTIKPAESCRGQRFINRCIIFHPGKFSCNLLCISRQLFGKLFVSKIGIAGPLP